MPRSRPGQLPDGRRSGAGAETRGLAYPDELRLKVQSWQTDSASTLTYLFVPDKCEQRLRGGQNKTCSGLAKNWILI